jgi:TrpR family transcriptional regulator, trp operon repressor
MKDKNINELVETLLKVKSREGALDLLKGLLTSQELDEVARRLQIVKMLKAGVSQREIVDKLKVGIATVTRGSKEIKKGRFKNV